MYEIQRKGVDNMSEQNEKVFTQDEIDRIVKERLKRERAKLDRELVDIQAEIDAKYPDYKGMYIDALKRKSLTDAGMPIEQVDRYVKYIEDSEDADEVKRQAREFTELAGFNGKGESKSKSNKSKWNPFG
jgi:hypothetical protein